MTNKKLTLLQTFNAMRVFLSLYQDKTHDEDIAILLGGLHLFQDRPDWEKNPTTWDSAAWEDWMDGVHKTLSDLQIKQSPKTYIYNEVTAFLCMKNYLELFYNQVPFTGVKNVLKVINKIDPVINNSNWKEWENAVNHAFNKTYALDQPLTQ